MFTTLHVASRWKAQKWGECSATCGVHGSHQRRVGCLQMNRYGNKMHWKVNSVYCSSLRMPKQQKACKRKACPGEWKTSSWSKVSFLTLLSSSHTVMLRFGFLLTLNRENHLTMFRCLITENNENNFVQTLIAVVSVITFWVKIE